MGAVQCGRIDGQTKEKMDGHLRVNYEETNRHFRKFC